jgi:hypothetical protein
VTHPELKAPAEDAREYLSLRLQPGNFHLTVARSRHLKDDPSGRPGDEPRAAHVAALASVEVLGKA